MPTLGTTELIILLVIVLILFGGSRIGELGGALGRGIREFKTSVRDDETPAVPEKDAKDAKPATTAAAASTSATRDAATASTGAATPIVPPIVPETSTATGKTEVGATADPTTARRD